MSNHKRKGRSIDHYWQFVKYKGDGAFYARCSCGFYYGCDKPKFGNATIPRVPDPEKLHHYCPNCGARKTKYYEEPIYIDRTNYVVNDPNEENSDELIN